MWRQPVTPIEDPARKLMKTTGTSSLARAFLSVLIAAMYLAASVRAAFPIGNDEPVRIALVIGNSRYENITPLKNPSNDERLIARTLKDLGFKVIRERDLTIEEFRETVRKFSLQAKSADTVVFYYAGHGFQYDGKNFLVPVDARLKDRKTFTRETFSMDDIILKLQGRGRDTLIFLDACRNNPMPTTKGLEQSTGLAQIQSNSSGAGGLYISFATQPGNVTLDGAAANSPFAKALAEHMPTRGIGVQDMMIRVRNSVEVATNGTQVPWEQSALRKQFYFNPSDEESDLTDEELEAINALPKEMRDRLMKQFAGMIRDSDREESFEVAAVDPDDLGDDEFDPQQPEDMDQAEMPEEEMPQDHADEMATPEPADDALTENPVASREEALPPANPDLADTSSDDVAEAVEGKTEALPDVDALPANDRKATTVTDDAKPLDSPVVAPVTVEAETPEAKPITESEVAAIEDEAPPDLLLNDVEDPTLAERMKQVPLEEPVVAETKVDPAGDGKIQEDAAPSPAILPDASVDTALAPKAEEVTPPATTVTETAAVETESEEEPALVLGDEEPDPQIDAGKPETEIAAVVPEADPKPEAVAPAIEAKVADEAADTDEAVVPPEDLAQKEALPEVVADKAEEKLAASRSDTSEEDNQISGLVEVESADAKPTTASPVITDSESLLPKTEDASKTAKKDQAEMQIASADIKTTRPELELGTQVAPSDKDAEQAAKDEADIKDYTREIQQELARLGCFRSRVDGKWGKKSDAALVRYTIASKREISLERDEQLLSSLKSDTSTSCPEPQVAENKASSKSNASKNNSTSKKDNRAESASKRGTKADTANTATSRRGTKDSKNTATSRRGTKSDNDNAGNTRRGTKQPTKKGPAVATSAKKKLKLGGGISF